LYQRTNISCPDLVNSSSLLLPQTRKNRSSKLVRIAA
jgi:hypothetical protein